MRIVCPACSAAYNVPDAMLRPGKRVRCARCGEHWSPVEIAVPPPPTPAVEPAPPLLARVPDALAMPEPEDRADWMGARPEHHPRRRPAGVDVWLGWLVTLVVLAALGWGAAVYRADIMRAWPPSQRLYAVLGLG